MHVFKWMYAWLREKWKLLNYLKAEYGVVLFYFIQYLETKGLYIKEAKQKKYIF